MKGKLLKGLLISSLIVGAAMPVTASAAEAGSVLFKLVGADTAKTEYSATAVNLVSIYDKAGNLLEAGADKDYVVTESSNTITGLEVGTYTVTLQQGGDGGPYVTVPLTAKTGDVTLSATLADQDAAISTIDTKKVGAIGGRIANANATTPVKLVAKSVTYTTYADSDGDYKFYAPAGKYDLIVGAKDDNYRKTLYSITVTAGQTAAPLEDLNTQSTAKYADSAFTIGNIGNGDKTVSGNVYSADFTINAYTVKEGKRTLLGTAKPSKVAKDAAEGTLPTYTVKFTKPQPNASFLIEAVDKAGNVIQRTDTTSAITASYANTTTRAVYGSAGVVITVTSDTYKLMTSANTVVKYTYGGVTNQVIDAAKVKVSGGKVTIDKGALPVGQGITLTLDNDMFDFSTESVSANVYQAKGTAAAVTTVSVATYGIAAPGPDNGGTTKVKFTKAADSNTVYYKVVSSLPTAPQKSDPLPSGVTSYTSEGTIPGVDKTTNKYVLLYETDANGIIRYKAITLLEKMIND